MPLYETDFWYPRGALLPEAPQPTMHTPPDKIRYDVFMEQHDKSWKRIGRVDAEPENEELFIRDYVQSKKVTGNYMALPNDQVLVFKVFVESDYKAERLK